VHVKVLVRVDVIEVEPRGGEGLERISARSCSRTLRCMKKRRLSRSMRLPNLRSAPTSDGIRRWGKTDQPSTKVKCKPTRSWGSCWARLTASSVPGAPIMILAADNPPERWAISTAALMVECRLKSSAVMMRYFDGAAARTILGTLAGALGSILRATASWTRAIFIAAHLRTWRDPPSP
jgi:hypothetical protein